MSQLFYLALLHLFIGCGIEAERLCGLLRRYGQLTSIEEQELVNGQDIHQLQNLLTLDASLHRLFDLMMIWFERAENVSNHASQELSNQYIYSPPLPLCRSPSTHTKSKQLSCQSLSKVCRLRSRSPPLTKSSSPCPTRATSHCTLYARKPHICRVQVLTRSQSSVRLRTLGCCRRMAGAQMHCIMLSCVLARLVNEFEVSGLEFFEKGYKLLLIIKGPNMYPKTQPKPSFRGIRVFNLLLYPLGLLTYMQPIDYQLWFWFPDILITPCSRIENGNADLNVERRFRFSSTSSSIWSLEQGTLAKERFKK